MNIDRLALLGLVGGGAYLVWQLSQTGQKAYEGYIQTVGRPVTPDVLKAFPHTSIGKLVNMIAGQFRTDLVTEGMSAEKTELLALKAVQDFKRHEARQEMLETIGNSGAF